MISQTTKKVTYVCSLCGSTNCGLDATAVWDSDAQEYVLNTTFDSSWCDECGHDDPGLKELALTQKAPVSVVAGDYIRVPDSERVVRVERIDGTCLYLDGGALIDAGELSADDVLLESEAVS